MVSRMFAAALATMAAAAVAAPAQAASSYPDGGSAFTSGTEGWVGSAASSEARSPSDARRPTTTTRPMARRPARSRPT